MEQLPTSVHKDGDSKLELQTLPQLCEVLKVIILLDDMFVFP